jgi:hypothetical protein
MRRLSITVLLISSVLLLPADAAGTNSSDEARQSSNHASTGSVPSRDAEQRMKECMSIWEPRTHMTKQQWRRTCKTLLFDPP